MQVSAISSVQSRNNYGLKAQKKNVSVSSESNNAVNFKAKSGLSTAEKVGIAILTAPAFIAASIIRGAGELIEAVTEEDDDKNDG